MRFQRTAVLLGTALLAWALGPLVVVLALGSLAVPRVRRWLRPTWRVTAIWAASLALLAGVVVLLPDGLLPIPPGAGALVTPGYTGSPVVPEPLPLKVPRHPRLAPHSTGSVTLPGPLGESPQVDTAWYGVETCASVSLDSQDRLVALCDRRGGPVLHVLDPDSMRAQDTMDLPEADVRCGTPYVLDDQDRAVVATAERKVLAVTTADGEGEPDLTIQSSYDLSAQVPEDDCVVALLPDWTGRLWWASAAGRVGFVDPGTGRATALELGEEVANGFAAGQDGSVYLVSVEALYRLGADRAGRPEVRWRTEYDRGTRQKDGQASRGSGTTPTLLPDGLVAIADNAQPRMNVQFYDTAEGDLVCQRAVFEDGESATDTALVAVGGGGVVVENNAGYTGPRRTVLGRTTPGGLARVDVADGTCDVAWTSEVAAPSAGPRVSLETGLVYTYAKRRSLLGVNAWYLTALDTRTGRTRWSVRTGIGMLFDNHRSAVTLAPDGSAYVGTLGGMVRVRDRS